MQQLGTDNRVAFWQLWLLYEDYLYRCCLRWMNGNPTQAEDALQLAMLKAYQKLPQYAGTITNLKCWLSQLCHNLCVDLKRKHNKEEIWNETLNFSQTDSNLMENAIATEMQDKLKQAVLELPEMLRQPLVWRVYEDKSYEDIAQNLSISPANARKRVQKARSKLKEQLAGYLCNEM